MYIFVTILIIIICLFLALIVLIQNPKGGGVNASFGGASQQIFGASRTTDVVEKTTWTLAVLLLTFSVCSAVFIPKSATIAATKGTGPKAASTTTAPAIPQDVKELEDKIKQQPMPAGQGTPPPANGGK